jgi:PIN like domain
LNFLFDHNLPPGWARALKELSKEHNERDTIEQVINLREKFPTNTPDAVWLSTLSREGGWTVISSDSFRKGRAEKEIVRQSGLNIFVLPKSWQSQTHWPRTARLIEWWPKLVATANSTRSVYMEVPWRISGKFPQIRV